MDKVSGVRVRLLPTTKIAALMNHQHLSLAPPPFVLNDALCLSSREDLLM